MEYVAAAFILLIGFVTFKLLHFTFHFLKKEISSFTNSIYTSNRKKKSKVAFPEDAFHQYSISQNEFSRIAMKTAYRHSRIDNVDIDGDAVVVTIISQSGASKSHARILFVLKGPSIGEYKIRRDNYDTTVPEKIADKIRTEIRKQAGLVV